MRTANVPSDRDAHYASLAAERREPRSERRRRQDESPGPLTVFKLGGSHAYAPELRVWLKAIGRARGSAVIVPGGGPFADAVRLAQKRMGFDDRAAHDMAMMAMAQFGRALMSFEPTLQLAASRAAIRRALMDKTIPVWAPQRMAGAANIPESWELTSDSLAAWLAREIGAKRLVLIKHFQLDGLMFEAEDLVARGIVDPLFPRYLALSGARAYLAPSGAAACFARESPRLALPQIATKEAAHGEA